QRRIGFGIRYLPTYVRQVAGPHDWATLVRGVDRYGNFELEQRPDGDMSEAAQAYHAAGVQGANRPPPRAGRSRLAMNAPSSADGNVVCFSCSHASRVMTWPSVSA